MQNVLSNIFATQVKRKVFVSYHHANDQYYYNELSRLLCSHYSVIQDNSLDRQIDSDNSDYVIRKIREDYITGSSCTVVLCGPQTRWRKYVDWEIKASLDRGHGLLGINLPNNPPDPAGRFHKPDRLQDNIDSGYALWTNWVDAMFYPSMFSNFIEQASAKQGALIVNNRQLRIRNG